MWTPTHHFVTETNLTNCPHEMCRRETGKDTRHLHNLSVEKDARLVILSMPYKRNFVALDVPNPSVSFFDQCHRRIDHGSAQVWVVWAIHIPRKRREVSSIDARVNREH